MIFIFSNIFNCFICKFDCLNCECLHHFSNDHAFQHIFLPSKSRACQHLPHLENIFLILTKNIQQRTVQTLSMGFRLIIRLRNPL